MHLEKYYVEILHAANQSAVKDSFADLFPHFAIVQHQGGWLGEGNRGSSSHGPHWSTVERWVVPIVPGFSVAVFRVQLRRSSTTTTTTRPVLALLLERF